MSEAASLSVGSSPRGRGTPVIDRRRENDGRFIPAWAGNARARTPLQCEPSVHPRVGGERIGGVLLSWRLSGSSPRGRGTHAWQTLWQIDGRFIPAWAGNANGPADFHPARPVHPRVGGERAARPLCAASFSGSSPRGRGTRTRSVRLIPRLWFIPAWAGNAVAPGQSRGRGTVHPRVGGERWFVLAALLGLVGSSPRGRGTRIAHRIVGVVVRFIPAWAGNASQPFDLALPQAVHPRVGGERGPSCTANG